MKIEHISEALRKPDCVCYDCVLNAIDTTVQVKLLYCCNAMYGC